MFEEKKKKVELASSFRLQATSVKLQAYRGGVSPIF